MKRDVVAIVCGAHIKHMCVESSYDMLPVEVQELVVKIYKHFHIYTVNVTDLQLFYGEAGE
jgi:hypothetical protein